MSGDTKTVLRPEVLWAQTNDTVFVTIPLGDVLNKNIQIKEGSFHFEGTCGAPKPSDYAVDFDLYAQVVPEETVDHSTDRQIVKQLKKKEVGNWPRLLSDVKKPFWLRIDFSRWKSESDSEPEFGADNNFSSMLSQMSNFNDYAGDDDVDSDDDDLPDLEPPKSMEEDAEDAKEKENHAVVPEATA